MTTKLPPRATTYTLVNERPHEGSRPPKSGPGFVRPVHPATYATLRLQARTARSFETTAPPDILAGWLLDHAYTPTAKTDSNPTIYAHFRRGDQVIVLYWSGSVLCQGRASDEAARTLLTLCEPTPATAGMFDSLEGGAE